MILKVLPFLILSATASASTSATEELTCGAVLSIGSSVTVVGKTDIKMGSEIPCSSAIYTHQDVLVMKHRDGYEVRFAPNTAVELKNEGTEIRLNKGSFLIRGSAGQKPVSVLTPNAIASFSGGSSWFTFDDRKNESRAACFTEKVNFQSRYVKKSSITVSAAEMSKVVMDKVRTTPSDPEFIDPATVKSVLKMVNLQDSEIDEFSTVVAEERDRREKNFASDFETWKTLEQDRVDNQAVSRKPASTVESVDRPEEGYFKEKFEEHVLGDETPQDVKTDAKLLKPKVKVDKTVAKDDTDVERNPAYMKEKEKILKEITTISNEEDSAR